MDEAAKALKSQFSGQPEEPRARLAAAIEALAQGTDAALLLETLQEEVEGTADEAALADAYAAVLGEGELDELPRAARLELYLHAAWACSQREDLEGATLQAATQALDLAPADERALALAEPLLLEAEQYGELANRYAVAATSAGSEARARQLLEHALHLLAPVPAATPSLLGLNERLNRLSQLRENDEALLAVAEHGNAIERCEAIIKLAQRWFESGSEQEGALHLRVEIGTLESEVALEALERLFDRAGDLERLELTLARRAKLEIEAIGRARALERLAVCQLERRRERRAASQSYLAAADAFADAGERDEALHAYERALEAVPDDVATATLLVRLHAAAGNFAAVARAFGTLLGASEDGRAPAELLLALAPAAERAVAAAEYADLVDDVQWRLGDAERELARRLQRSSARLHGLAARYDDAAELYRRLIAERATSEDLDAYQALIDAHPGSDWRRGQQRWLFEWREHHCSDRPTILLSWARFEEQELGDREGALQVLDRAAELAPDRAEIWENLARLRLIEGDSSGGLRAADELRRLGRELEPGLVALLLEQEPTARWALDRMKLLLSSERRWPELFALYERAIDATDGVDDRARLLDEAAIAARDVAQDRSRAIGYWEQHAALVPGDARIELALDRLYELTGDKRGAVAHTRRRLTRASDAVRPALLHKLARLCLDAGALDEAFETAEELLPIDSDKAHQIWESVLSLSLALPAEDARRSAGLRAAELLRASPELAENSAEKARLLRAELSLSPSPDERRRLLAELSKLCERELLDFDAAFDVERELFSSSGDEKTRKRLEKLAKKCERFAELCQTLADVALTRPEVRERQRLLLRAAELAQAPLRDEKLARQLFRRFFEQDAASAVQSFYDLSDAEPVPESAFAALCDLLESSARFAELAQVLAVEAQRSQGSELWLRLAALQADRLGAPAQAISTFLKAHDLRSAAQVLLRAPSVLGDDPTTALELSLRLASSGDAPAAAGVLRHQLEHYGHHGTAERKKVQLELVRVLEAGGDSDAADRELGDVARRFPTDADVQRASAESAAARQDWPRAEQSYRTLLLLVHGGKSQGMRRSGVYVALSRLKHKQADADAATELLECAFETALGDSTELAALAQSLLDDEQWDEAERAGRQLLELADAGHELSSGERLGAELARAGALLAGQDAEKRARAIANLEAMVEEQAAPVAAWTLLARAWERDEDDEKLARALGQLLAKAPEDPKLLGRALRCAVKLNDADRAVEYADRAERAGIVLEAELVRGLRQLFTSADKTERVIHLLHLEARLEPSAPKRAALLLEVAERERNAGRMGEALEACSEARTLDPSSAEAVLLLAQLTLARSERDQALKLLTQYAESKERKRGRPLSRVLRLAADLHLQRDELAEALPLLQEAHGLDKSDLDTALSLSLLAIDLDRLETAASALRVLIASRELGTREGAAARSLTLASGYFQLARIEQHHGKKTNAKRMALRALEEDPHHVPAQRLLSELSLS